MTNKKNNKVVATNEILGATLTANMSKSDILSFEKDPRSFIASSLKADTGDVSLSMVENSDGLVNLALPYYSQLDGTSARVLSDDAIDSVSGGELLISLTTLAIGAGVCSVAGVGGVAGLNALDGRDLDGNYK